MKNILFIAIAFLLVLVFGCKDQSVNPSSQPKGNVSITFGKAPANIAQVIARMTRAGYDDLVLTLSIADTERQASGTFTDVAVGTWHLKVDATDDLGKIRYTGQTDLEVIGGQLTSVSLELSATTGDVEIFVTWGSNCTASPSGLVSWWTAEGNANDRIGTNDGVLVDSVTFAEGKVGRAFNFDGSASYVYVSNSPSLNPSGSFTIEGWIYPVADISMNIIAKWRDDAGAPDQRSWQLGIRQGGSLRFAISDSAHQRDGLFHVFDSDTGVVRVLAWNHVACVYDHSSGKRLIFVNGVNVAERTDPPISISNSSSEVTIGTIRIPGSSLNYAFFKGMIDELSFYNRALSRLEIETIHNSGTGGRCR